MAARNFFRTIIIMMVSVVSLFTITSCDKYEDDYLFDVTTQGSNGENTETGVTVTITRDSENGTAVLEERIDGELVRTATITAPLGGVNFTITPLDTTFVASPEVSSVEFAKTGSNTVAHENVMATVVIVYADGSKNDTATIAVSCKKTNIDYIHEMNVYSKEINIDFLNGEVYYWGKEIKFNDANGSVSFEGDINVADEGINGNYHYYLSTSSYKVAFMQGSSVEKGFERLAVDANDVLVSTKKTNEGYETLTSTTAKSWIEVTRTYKIADPVTTRYEVILINGIAAPAYAYFTSTTFNMNQIVASLGNASVSGNRTEPNIAITGYSQNYVVGNNLFNKTFVFSYEKAVWSDGTNSFDMPYRKYENINDKGFVNTPMSEQGGFERKLNTHSVSATFNGNSASAKAETEVKVEKEDEPVDELVSRNVIEDGFDYVNGTTSRTWVKIKEIWSISGEKTYTKETNLTNGITAPASIQRILADFNLVQSTAVLGSTKLVNTTTSGDFLIQTYEVKYTVGNDRFTREFSFRYQKATYTVMNYAMPFRAYENISDNGFNLSDMSNTTQNNIEYTRKGYVHGVSATFNGHSASASGNAELLVEVVLPRETPEWLGALVSAKYTRVQLGTDKGFIDMIHVEYENGCITAPKGDKNQMVISAYTQALANANGVKYTQRGVFSGVYVNGTLEPAVITITGGRWDYTSGCAGNYNHTVHQNNAVTHGIGVDVTPIPSAQSYKINGNQITIKYAANNGSTSANASFSIR